MDSRSMYQMLRYKRVPRNIKGSPRLLVKMTQDATPLRDAFHRLRRVSTTIKTLTSVGDNFTGQIAQDIFHFIPINKVITEWFDLSIYYANI